MARRKRSSYEGLTVATCQGWCLYFAM